MEATQMGRRLDPRDTGLKYTDSKYLGGQKFKADRVTTRRWPKQRKRIPVQKINVLLSSVNARLEQSIKDRGGNSFRGSGPAPSKRAPPQGRNSTGRAKLFDRLSAQTRNTLSPGYNGSAKASHFCPV